MAVGTAKQAKIIKTKDLLELFVKKNKSISLVEMVKRLNEKNILTVTGVMWTESGLRSFMDNNNINYVRRNSQLNYYHRNKTIQHLKTMLNNGDFNADNRIRAIKTINNLQKQCDLR